MEPLPCIICGKKLDEAAPGSINQPYKGTAFESRGHYGSTVWDEVITITVCDDCLRKAAEKKIVLRVHPHRQQIDYDCRPWDPEED